MHWHPWVDWDSWNPGTILDLRHPSRQDWDNVVQGGLGQSASTHWISMALAVDCDPGQSSPFKADWDSVGILGQSGTILDNLQGRLGSQCGLGQRGILGQSSIPLDTFKAWH